MRVVFMGTPDFGSVILTHLLKAGHELVGAFCQPDRPKGRRAEPQPPPAKVCCGTEGIAVHQPRRLGKKSRELLEAMAPDVIVVAAYGLILPSRVLAIPRFGCINVHASLLPKYRGAAPIHWAIANGEAATGVTIMQMDEGLDTGAALSAESLPIGPGDTAESLHDRLAEVGGRLLVQTMAQVAAGVAEASPQDDAAATWAPQLTREDGQVDWRWNGTKIADRVRGFYPWPGAHTLFRGKVLKLFPHLLPETVDDTAPGVIAAISRAGLTVGCGDGAVLIPEVQLAGRKRMAAADFAAGARIEVGEILGVGAAPRGCPS